MKQAAHPLVKLLAGLTLLVVGAVSAPAWATITDDIDPMGSIIFGAGPAPTVLTESDQSGVWSIVNLGSNTIKLINFKNPSFVRTSTDPGATETSFTMQGRRVISGAASLRVRCHTGGSVSETIVDAGTEMTCSGFDRVDIEVILQP